MFTEEQLKQLRKVMQEEMQENNKILREEMQANKKEILAKQEADKKELMTKIDQQGEEMGEFFHKTWEVIEENKRETDERLTTLEEHTGITSKN